MAKTSLSSASIVLLSAVGACVLPDLSLDGRPCPCASGYACDSATHTCVKGSGATGGAAATGATGTSPNAMSATATSSASSTSSTAASMSSSSSSSSGGPLKPLVYETQSASGTISVRVDNSFRLQSTAASAWQWNKWYDLASGATDNLASTAPQVEGDYSQLLLEPAYLNDGAGWHDATTASVTSLTVTDETPARVVVDAVLGFQPAGTQLRSTYAVYASGRVASLISVKNIGTTVLNFPMTESGYISVNGHLANGTLAWAKTSYNSLSGGFLRQDGPSPKSSLLMVNTQKLTDLTQDSMTTNWYWGEAPSETILPGQSFAFSSEIQLGPGDQTQVTHASRADDVLNPGLTVASGGTPAGTGFDIGRSAYTITADPTATSVVFGATSDHMRYWPAFLITGFTPPKWHVTLGGQEIVSSTTLDGTGALASSANNEIVIVLGGAIAKGAPDAARLLTLEAQ